MDKRSGIRGGAGVAMILAGALCTISYNVAAAEPASQNWNRVNIHVENRANLSPNVLKDGQQAATAIFAEIDVQLTWGNARQQAPGRNTACIDGTARLEIGVEIVAHAPAHFSDAALAIARPYAGSGVQVVVFYDRVAPLLAGHRAPASIILGYVLAHEIGHVLEGVARHSETGVMRARWLDNDFKQMGMGTLRFTDEDAQLMERGLIARGGAERCATPLFAKF